MSLSLTALMSCEALEPVSYTYRPLAAEGCSVEYSVVLNDDIYQIVVRVKADDVDFTDNPEMLLKLFDGTALYLHGERLEVTEEDVVSAFNNNVMQTTSFVASARFSISERDLI